MANEKVDAQVVDALTIGNAKTIGEAASFAIASLMQHQVKHQQRLDMMAEAHLAKSLNTFSSVDATEAVATAKLFKGESDSSLHSLLAALASGQIAAKTAQSTPGDISVEVAKLGHTVGSLQASMASLIGMLQQAMKGAQSTPPESGK